MAPQWIDHIRVRRTGAGQYDMFVASVFPDQGQKHFGLSMAEVHDKIDEYEEEMVAQPVYAPMRNIS